MEATDNYRKHTVSNSPWKFKFFQKFLINIFFKTLLALSRKLDPVTVLDVGCGEGFTLEKFRENGIGKELTGIDFSEAAIKIGKKLHPHIALQSGTIYNIPFKANSFDLVLCTEVLEHLEYPEKALNELERVTKKYCIISVPNEPWFMLGNLLRGKNLSRWGNDIEHINHWSRSGINVLVGKYFSVTEIKNPLPWTLLIAEKRN